MIKVKNLSFEVSGKKFLKNISLSIEENKTTGIIGKNGSGKTTLIKHLSKEIKSKDKIFINNKSIEKLKIREFSKLAAFLAQDFENVGNFKIRELIKIGRYPYKKLFRDYSDEDEKIVDKLIEEFRLEKIKDSEARCVSGGELKLAFIARCLAQKTKIMILDEPVNHLDINYQLKLMNFLSGIKDKTIVLSVHNLDFALKFCDNVIILKNGELYDCGSTEEIFTEKMIKEVFEVDCEIIEKDEQKIIIYK